MIPQIYFYNHEPKLSNFYQAVIKGFSQPQKSLPPKFFYDETGSRLFDKICEQPEYYLPDVEKNLLTTCMTEIYDAIGDGCTLIEPGAGNLSKIKLLLNKINPTAYVPIDISSRHLQSASLHLAKDYPRLTIHSVCADFTHSLPLPDSLPQTPRVGFFPGSSLGNFHKNDAIRFLSLVRQTLGKAGKLLIGVDTKKAATLLHAAYNDAAGTTAAFNLNLLHRIRKELKADFDPDFFEHYAFYNAVESRIEMHLVSKRKQHIYIDNHRFTFKAGESLHTENSYKYSPEDFIFLAQRAGYHLKKYWLAEDELFAIYLLEAESP